LFDNVPLPFAPSLTTASARTFLYEVDASSLPESVTLSVNPGPGTQLPCAQCDSSDSMSARQPFGSRAAAFFQPQAIPQLNAAFDGDAIADYDIGFNKDLPADIAVGTDTSAG